MNYFLWGTVAIFAVALIEIFLNKLVDDLIPPATTKFVRILYLGVIFVLAWIAFSAGSRSGETITPQAEAHFTYQIRVQTAEETPVVGADVALDVPGSTSILASSNTSGVAVLEVPEIFIGETAVLYVSAANFKGHRQFVTVRQSQLPQLIYLESK